MKYLKKLSKSLHDDRSVAVEMFLAWIAVMLTILAVFSVLYYVLPQ